MGIDGGVVVQLVNSPGHASKFGMCCVQGKVQLPHLDLIPQTLHRLYTNGDPDVKALCHNIHYYSIAFTFNCARVIPRDCQVQPCVCTCLSLLTASADTTCHCRCRRMTARRSTACLSASAVSAYGAKCAS